MAAANFNSTDNLSIIEITEAELAAAIIMWYNAEHGTAYTVADFGAGEGDAVHVQAFEGWPAQKVLQYTSADDAVFDLTQVDNE